MKKAIGTLLAMILMMTGTALAAQADANLAAATAVVPAGAAMVEHEMDDGFAEYKFIIAATGEEFEVKIDPFTGLVFSVESDLDDQGMASAVTLSEEDAQLKVVDDAANGELMHTALEFLHTSLKGGDKHYAYVLLFQSGEMLGAFEVNAETGIVLERKIYPSALAGVTFMPPADVIKAIESGHAGAQVQYIDISSDKRVVYYEGKALLDGVEYEFEYTLDGTAREWERD